MVTHEEHDFMRLNAHMFFAGPLCNISGKSRKLGKKNKIKINAIKAQNDVIHVG